MHESKKTSINKQMAKGAIWMVSFKLIEKSIGLVSTVILARLLIPEDFGLVAMGMIVVAFVELLRAFNFDIALIQNQEATDDHYNTVWSMNILAASLIALVMIIAGPLVVVFFDDERLLNIMYALSVGVFFSGFENVGVVAFRKELTFHKEFVYLLGKKLIGFVVAISLALYYGNYWALIGGMVAAQVGVVILSYFVHHYRPAFCLKKWRELFGFSSWLLLNNILFFMNNKLPELMVGKLLGPVSLGIYSISYEISNMPSTELIAPINRAVFPGYSKLKNSFSDLRESYLDTLAHIAFLAVPAALGLASIAPVFVPVVFGEKWLNAIPIIQNLAIAGAFTALMTNSGAIYMAIGRPYIITWLTLLKLIIYLPGILLGIKINGLVGASVALFVAEMIMFPVRTFVIRRTLDIQFLEFVKNIIRPLVASLTMYLTLSYFSSLLVTNTDNVSITSLLFFISVGILIYLFCILFLWLAAGRPLGVERHYLKKIKQFRGSSRAT